ncbi:hypothetical protein V1281_001962 [Nitrobacteraceae bacterium AZCC 2161]
MEAELKAVSVVNETVQDGVAQGGIAEAVMMPASLIVWCVGFSPAVL